MGIRIEFWVFLHNAIYESLQTGTVLLAGRVGNFGPPA